MLDLLIQFSVHVAFAVALGIGDIVE